MIDKDPGFRIVRFGDMEWEPRTENKWPCLTKRHLYDPARNLTCRFVWYTRGAVERRHVHGGSHAAFVMLDQANVDGKVLGPCDVVYDAGGVPHGRVEFLDDVFLAVTGAGTVTHEPLAA